MNKENSKQNGFRVNRELEEILDRSPKSNDAKKCDFTNRIGKDEDHYFVSKAILPEDYAVYDCWKNIIDSLLNDNPLKPGSFRNRKNTSPEKNIRTNVEKNA